MLSSRLASRQQHSLRIEHLDGDDVYNTTLARRWRSAFAAITFFKTLLTRAQIAARNKLLPTTQYPYSRVDHDQIDGTIDGPKLSQLVKQKNKELLQELGGIPGILKALKTDAENGIPGDDRDVTERRRSFGSNSDGLIKLCSSKSFIFYLLHYLKDVFNLIFLTCAVLSLVLIVMDPSLEGGLTDSVGTIVGVFLFSLFCAVFRFRQDRQLVKNSEAVDHIKNYQVMRGGRQQLISKAEILVGDVLCLKAGDQIPADGLFLDCHSLLADESSVTGKSEHVRIDCTHNPFLCSGAKVVDGCARMLVTSVGINMTRGQTMSRSSGRTINVRKTPLQAQLDKLKSSINMIGVFLAFVCLVTLLVHYFKGISKLDDGTSMFSSGKKKFVYLLYDVGWIVASAASVGDVAIPELVPVKLGFLKGGRANPIIVKKLSAAETMGFVTTLCTNKTGILTLNQMTVTEFWIGQQTMNEIPSSSISKNVVELIRQGIALNTSGTVHKAPSESEFELSGSPTEKAVLSCGVSKLGMDMEEYKRNFTGLHFQPFNSQTKMSWSLVQKKADNTFHVHLTGAADIILARCSRFFDAFGSIRGINDEEKAMFDGIIQSMSSKSLRCIAFAHKVTSEQECNISDLEYVKYMTNEEEGFTLLGIMGISDPCNRAVNNDVEYCRRAGVNIKLITGDNIFTAKAIATKCGILRYDQDPSNTEAVVLGEEFRNYTQEERMEKVDKIRVMARCSPSDKLLMVQCLKQKGRVVAVIGGGTNNIPLLKEANVGISIGRQAGEVAEEGSDIIVLNDILTNVVAILRWQSCYQSNVRKFIQFRLAVSVSSLVINLVSSLLESEVPLNLVQSLWLSLVADTLAGLALIFTDLTTDDFLEKQGVMNDEQPLISNTMWRNLLGQALYQIAVVLILQLKGESIFGVTEDVKYTLIFNVTILCHVFNIINATKHQEKNVFKGIHKDKWLLGTIGMIIVVQVVMVEAVNRLFGSRGLNWEQWRACLVISSVSLPIGWIVKHVPVPAKPILGFVVKQKQHL